MAGSIASASASVVLPWNLASSFTQSRAFLLDINSFVDAEVQRSLLTATSRKRWSLSHRLNATTATALRTFYLARKGGHELFYFYDVHETSTLYTYDATGVATVGRYTVRFDGPFELAMSLGRHTTRLSLIEVA